MAGKMTASEFLSLPYVDILAMDEREVRQMASRAAQMLNRRATNIRYNRNASVLALRQVQGRGQGGRFSLRGSDGKPISGAELADEVARMKQFAENPASTVRGAKARLEEIEKDWFGGTPQGSRDEMDTLRLRENKAYDIADQLRALLDEYYRVVINRIDASKESTRGGSVTAADAIEMLNEIIRDGQEHIDRDLGQVRTINNASWFRKGRK